MSEVKLISFDNFAEYKSLSKNIKSSLEIDQYILEAQMFDLKPLLGRELYVDLLVDFEDNGGNPSDTYKDLYDGIAYTYQGRKYKNPGLIPVIVYFAYARYVINANGKSTEFGIVQKVNEESKPISDADTGRRISQAREGALAYWSDVETYLNQNKSSYTLWKSNLSDKSETGLPTFNDIG